MKRFCVLQGFKEHYSFLNKLGSGNFGTVFKVQSKATNEIFAAKAYYKDEFEKHEK